LIERKTCEIYCSPIFNSEQALKSDILIFTDRTMTRSLFQTYQFILDGLSLKASLWDIEANDENVHETKDKQTWVDKFQGKSVILSTPCDNFFKFSPTSIFSHFEHQDEMNTSGFVVSKVFKKDPLIFHLHEGSVHDKIARSKLEEKFYFNKPMEIHMRDLIIKMESQLIKENSLHRFHIKYQFQPQLTQGGFLADLYYYGDAWIRKIPIQKDESLLILPDFGEIKIPDLINSQRSIHTRDPIFKFIFTFLLSLSIQKKLDLIESIDFSKNK
jgi:hypothetical protein